MNEEVKKKLPIVVTVTVTILALIALLFLVLKYWRHPWTRDGQVQALVVEITPRVSGPIVDLPIHDNQKVKKGDLLFRIDPRTFEARVRQSQASLDRNRALAAEASDEALRVQRIFERNKEAISIRKVTATEHAREAALAAVEEAKASLEEAQLDLEFTEIRAPVDGYISNLKLNLGDQVVKDKPAVALIDTNSFWVYGFFKETHIGRIQVGDIAIVKLMAYPDKPIEGVVKSLGWGIAQNNGGTGRDLLIDVNPSFDWIRLAQRIPVVITCQKLPKDLELRVGMTASVYMKREGKNASCENRR